MRTAAIPQNKPGSGPASSDLAAVLRESICGGEFQVGCFIPTERALAAKHSVGRMTARRALKTLEREGLIASRPGKGYRVMARAGDPSLGCPVAFLLSSENVVGGLESLYRSLGDHLRKRAEKLGWKFLSVVAPRESIDSVLPQLGDARAWGMVIDSSYPEVLAAANRAGMPVVAVDNWDPDAGYDAVVQDDFHGGTLAAEHLAAAGHERIAWFGPGMKTFHTEARYGGAAAALARRELDFSHKVTRSLASKDLLAPAKELLTAKDRPTGILALWGTMAAALHRAARELGLEVGRDFDLVSWCAEEVYEDGFKPIFADGPVPPAVTWSAAEMAEAAIDRLDQRRTRPKMTPARISVPVRLRIAR